MQEPFLLLHFGCVPFPPQTTGSGETCSFSPPEGQKKLLLAPPGPGRRADPAADPEDEAWACCPNTHRRAPRGGREDAGQGPPAVTPTPALVPA